MTDRVNELAFYQDLANLMNAHPDRYGALGEMDFTLGVVMADEAGGDLRLRLRFEELGCTEVSSLREGGEDGCDCWLNGDLPAWEEMFEDITTNGLATGRRTINSLTLVGDRIDVKGDDPMGVDKFFRFIETIQQFLDGAAQLAPAPA